MKTFAASCVAQTKNKKFAHRYTSTSVVMHTKIA